MRTTPEECEESCLSQFFKMLSVYGKERIQKANPGESGNSDAISTLSFSQRKSSWMRCLIFIEQKKWAYTSSNSYPSLNSNWFKRKLHSKSGMCFCSWKNAQVILRATLTRFHSLTSNEDSVPLEHRESLAHADQPGREISHYSCEIKLAWNLFKSKQLMEFQRLNCPNKFKETVHPKKTFCHLLTFMSF